MSVLVLSGADVSKLTASVSAQAVCAVLGKAMSAISNHQSSDPAIQNPQRIATDSDYYKNLYMPSRLTTSEGSTTAIKIVGVPKPACPIPGLPATTLVFDESTGLTRAVVNAAELTGIRTAAASALASKILADASAGNLLVFGSGTQAYYHARLILQLFPSIGSCTFIVRSKSSRATTVMARLVSEFASVAFDLRTAETSSEAVKQADIICTCVPSTAPLFKAEDLKAGVHINAIGSYTPSMQEFPPSLISPATPSTSPSSPYIPTVLTDSTPACLAEAGELITAQIPASHLVELGTLLDPASGEVRRDAETEERIGKLRERGRSLFKCVGIGGMDVAITKLVVDEAERLGLGARVAF
ncbi:uncharacterized protein JCM10292_006281 [Rhodotorula paludigena]|uniref:uncharacterized protein n=1 Tax=Rhodotorula paludigena TaxID=86838 RepID=UPI00317C5BB3